MTKIKTTKKSGLLIVKLFVSGVHYFQVSLLEKGKSLKGAYIIMQSKDVRLAKFARTKDGLDRYYASFSYVPTEEDKNIVFRSGKERMEVLL